MLFTMYASAVTFLSAELGNDNEAFPIRSSSSLAVYRTVLVNPEIVVPSVDCGSAAVGFTVFFVTTESDGSDEYLLATVNTAAIEGTLTSWTTEEIVGHAACNPRAKPTPIPSAARPPNTM